MAATMLAIVSLIGMLHQIPAAPMKVGKMIRHGSRNSNWRVSDRNIALFAIPILWKKLDVTIWKPTIGNTNTAMRKPSAALLISPSSVVKMETVNSGISSPTRKVKVVTTVAHHIANFKTSFTRWYCCAP